MKRILTLSACAVMAFTAVAQTQIKMPNLENLRKDVAKSDVDIANPKKGENPKTWIQRAEKFVNVYDKSTMGAAQNMHKAIFATLTQSKKIETIDGVEYEVLVFPSIDLYFDQQDLLALWKEKETAVDRPLSQAYLAYLKAIELDAKGAQAKKVSEGLTALAAKLRSEGVNAYTSNDYKSAQQNFIESVEASYHPLVGRLDTIIAYYAGVVSLNESVLDYDNAIRYLQLCINNSYYFDDGSVYANLAKAYQGKGDTLAQEQLLTEGFLKFPTNQAILIELINLYLNSGENATKVIPYLKKAQENEPTNATLYFAEATLYEKLKMMDDAERMYLKTIEVDSSSYNAYYNLGALYYNRAVEYIKEAGEIKDWRSPKIKELEATANVEFKRSLTPFIKAHELQPNDKYALENVKNIYFRFREENPEMMAKYNEYNAKYTTLQQ
jgi:tetratricopeptide (TPR) repeat protein